jgi:hypothetical protein
MRRASGRALADDELVRAWREAELEAELRRDLLNV